MIRSLFKAIAAKRAKAREDQRELMETIRDVQSIKDNIENYVPVLPNEKDKK